MRVAKKIIGSVVENLGSGAGVTLILLAAPEKEILPVCNHLTVSLTRSDVYYRWRFFESIDLKNLVWPLEILFYSMKKYISGLRLLSWSCMDELTESRFVQIQRHFMWWMAVIWKFSSKSSSVVQSVSCSFFGALRVQSISYCMKRCTDEMYSWIAVLYCMLACSTWVWNCGCCIHVVMSLHFKMKHFRFP